MQNSVQGSENSNVNQILNSQNPQASGSSQSPNFASNNASDFQNPTTLDALNQAQNQSLHVASTGQPAPPPKGSGTPWRSIAIALGLLVVLAVLFVLVVRFSRKLKDGSGVEESMANSPFLKPTSEKDQITSAPLVTAEPKTTPTKKKKSKGPPGRRRK